VRGSLSCAVTSNSSFGTAWNSVACGGRFCTPNCKIWNLRC